nr:RecName: Full=Vegetative protein 6; Short=VEG6 [Bacillus subtilis]
LGTGLGVDQN